ncbi:hypothetical protein V6N11_080476 [Hibiscus sabdariffa]|uniref:Reverse transcriptase zinc-binding domain-containing protein n=1 Tax=Hibiscus sabdariffa TaxID=183260 RepID=A0ABR2R7T8_9ROSI
MEGNPSCCVLCKTKEEDSTHLFDGCSFVRIFWNQFCDWWGVNWVGVESFDALLKILFSVNFSGHICSLWLIALAATLWSIWLMRNENIFYIKKLYVKELLFNSKMRALVWMKALKSGSFGNADDWWERPITCLNVGCLGLTHWLRRGGDLTFVCFLNGL